HEIELEHAAAAVPADALVHSIPRVTHSARLTMRSRILLIAAVGVSFFGQTSAQFMIEWQRKRRYGSSRLSRRSFTFSSRVSAMKRYAHSSPAGPTNLSGFHQNDGHDVEQQAQ